MSPKAALRIVPFEAGLSALSGFDPAAVSQISNQKGSAPR